MSRPSMQWTGNAKTEEGVVRLQCGEVTAAFVLSTFSHAQKIQVLLDEAYAHGQQDGQYAMRKAIERTMERAEGGVL